jgi:diguanylate cyclase (GGDEF)-like protein
VNQAFVDTYEGRLDIAVSRCLQSLSLLERQHSRIEIRVWFTLAWNSFFLGDYPAALENGIKALDLARGFNDELHTAWSLDAVASFYGITGDMESAIQLHEEALMIFRALNEVVGELRTLNNLAVSLLGMKHYDRAYEVGIKSLQLAQQHRLDMDICNNSCTVADILIGMNKLNEAETCLEESLPGHMHGSSVANVFVLERMARLRLTRNDLQGAESFALQALVLADELNQKAEQALCHETLSRIYEEQSQHTKALEHYKKHHEFHKEVQNEQTAILLAVLKITHQVETARREAEIYRLEASELQRKVDEQKLIQSILEFQNTIDPMTNLHNRRHFDNVLVKEYSRHSRSGAELSLLIMDVDYFKPFNDTYGHIGGDHCLQQIAHVIKNSITRPPDVAFRYGGEEFICLLPETGFDGAKNVAEKIHEGVIRLGIPHVKSAAAEIVTISIGAVTSKCSKDGSPLDIVASADEQLYLAKSSGRNCIRASRVM